MKANTDFLHEGEHIALEDFGSYVKGAFNNKVGRLVLTNQRLVLFSALPWLALFGLLGLLMEKKSKSKPKVDITLSNISSVEPTKYGINKKVFKLTMNDGSEHVFTCGKPVEEWISHLKK